MGFKSEARGSRRNKQPSPVPVRLLSKERRRPKRSFGISFHEKATVETRRNHSFRRSLTSTSRSSAKHLLPTFKELMDTTNKKAHNRKARTPSFRRRHKMFKQTNNSSDQALYSKETKLGLTSSLPSKPSSQLQLVTSILSPHPSPSLPQPVHGERKTFLAVTASLFGSSNPATKPHAFPGTTYPGS